VKPVCLPVCNVIENIDRARKKAKHDKGLERSPDVGFVEEVFRKNKGGKDEEVFEPLFGPKQTHNRAHSVSPLLVND
jgi:hypothetical protein